MDKKCLFFLILVILCAAGCRQWMADEGRIKPMEENKLFGDVSSVRHPVEGTVARGHLKGNTVYFTGTEDGGYAARFPVDVTHEFIARGQERFDIYCAVCHGRTGEGNGMIVQRGFTRPPSYYEKRLREAEPGYFFHVITEGYGDMANYNDVLNEYDRWAVAAYIKTLQQSRNVPVTAAPEEIKDKLKDDVNAKQGNQ